MQTMAPSKFYDSVVKKVESAFYWLPRSSSSWGTLGFRTKIPAARHMTGFEPGFNWRLIGWEKVVDGFLRFL